MDVEIRKMLLSQRWKGGIMINAYGYEKPKLAL